MDCVFVGVSQAMGIVRDDLLVGTIDMILLNDLSNVIYCAHGYLYSRIWKSLHMSALMYPNYSGTANL